MKAFWVSLALITTPVWAAPAAPSATPLASAEIELPTIVMSVAPSFTFTIVESVPLDVIEIFEI